MTGWWLYDPAHPSRIDEEFYGYFEGKDTFEIFTSFLVTSYETSVMSKDNPNEIYAHKVYASIKEGKASYIVETSSYGYFAGEEECLSETDLFRGLMNRLLNYKSYINPVVYSNDEGRFIEDDDPGELVPILPIELPF